MKLRDNGDHYAYDLGTTLAIVSRLLVDAALTLEMVPPGVSAKFQVSIAIGGKFRYGVADGDVSEFDPEGDREGLGPVLGLWTPRLSGIRIDEDASLILTFTDGRTLIVAPDPNFEAWTLIADWHAVAAVIVFGGAVVAGPAQW